MKNVDQKLYIVFMLWIVIGITSNMIVYDLESYDCHDMSIELHDRFESVGIESHYEWAQTSKNSAHIWIVVDICGIHIPIESTNYAAMPYPEYLQFYFNSDGRFDGDTIPPDHVSRPSDR